MRLPYPLPNGLILLGMLTLQPLPALEAGQVGTPSAAGGPVQAASGTLHIHGTVTDGVTGKPIVRALVTSADRRLATMTDSQGAFSLNVELESGTGQDGRAPRDVDFSHPGQIYLTAQRPDYLPQDTRPAAVPLDSAAEAQPVQLKLMPVATVTGHVFNEHSEPAHDVLVDLIFRSARDGERTWNRIGMHRTDADGSFRFSGLNPGEYTVMTEEWRGDNPLPPGDDAITEQYPPMYLGDAAELTSANKLQVHFGETAQADLHLHTATYYPVTVPVTGDAEGFVNVRISGGDAESGFHLGYVPGRHAVEGSLPNGTYGLELTCYPQGNRQRSMLREGAAERSYGVASVHIAGAAVHTAAVVMTVPPSIAVRVHRQFTGRDVPEHLQVRVYLQPVETGQPFVTASNEEGGGDELTLPGAAPGQYGVHVEPSYGYPAQVSGGGVDLRAAKLTVNAGGSQPLEVVLRDDTATVEGTVRATGAQPASSAPQPTGEGQVPRFVVLTPVNGDGTFSIAGAGSDGHFLMANVVPGSYRVFAIDGSLWNSPYRDPEALRTVKDKGAAVDVSPGARLQVEVPMLDAAALESK